LITTSFIGITMLTACFPLNRGPIKSRVILTHHRGAYRLAILVKDLGENPRIRPRDPLPFSHNASGAVWVGVKFPFEKAKEIILLSRNYYKELKYFALSDKRPGVPESVHRTLYIGGSTSAALNMKLLAWSEEEFAQLKKIKTKEEFFQLIRSRYGDGKRKKRKPLTPPPAKKETKASEKKVLQKGTSGKKKNQKPRRVR